MPLPSPAVSDVLGALQAFLLDLLPITADDVVQGLVNRVGEPGDTTFIVMTPIRFERLATNIDAQADCRFVGSITANVLTVVSIDIGSIGLGLTVFAAGVAPGTTITKFLDGEGGAGTYQVSRNQTVAQATMSAGATTLTQEARVVVQLDFHSLDTTSGDYAQAVSTALRDEFATTFFAALPPPQNSVAPLHADDPRQAPFLNAEQQYEWRWVLEAHFQANQILALPAQYADEVALTLKDVDAVFPP